MNNEINFIRAQVKDAYEGSPWFGRSAKSLLAEVSQEKVFRNNGEAHNALQILWHMITWREFVIDRLQHSPQMQLEYFDRNDWRALDLSDTTLWQQGLERLAETQTELVSLLERRDDDILDKQVFQRDYNFRYMLHGFIQHDAYHLGQIAQLNKLV